MRKLSLLGLLLVVILAAIPTSALAGGIGGIGAGVPEIDAQTAVTALGLLAGWAAVIRGRWSKKRTEAAAEPEDGNKGTEDTSAK